MNIPRFQNPQDIPLSCGKSQIMLDGKNAFAFKEWQFDGKVICCDAGFNGTVIANAPGKFIGVGHHEGGSEIFDDLNIAIAAGNELHWKRKTRLGNLQISLDYHSTEMETLSSCRYQAADIQKIALFYVHQYSWSTEFDRYIFLDGNGSWQSGDCQSQGEMIYFGHCRCAALFAPAYQLAIAFAPDPRLTEIATGKLWDRHIYHKFYCELDFKGDIPAGEISPEFIIRQTILPAAEENFTGTVKAWAETLPEYWKNLPIVNNH